MAIINFARGPNHLMLLDLDTFTLIPNVAWADPEDGSYQVFVTDDLGKLRLNEFGAPLREERTGHIAIISQPQAYCSYLGEVMYHSVQHLLAACKFSLAVLTDLTTADFSHGGDRVIRERLTAAINAAENLLAPGGQPKIML